MSEKDARFIKPNADARWCGVCEEWGDHPTRKHCTCIEGHGYALDCPVHAEPEKARPGPDGRPDCGYCAERLAVNVGLLTENKELKRQLLDRPVEPAVRGKETP